MKYEKTITLRDGRKCILRNANAADALNVLHVFRTTHAQTDFNLTYPEEMRYTSDDEARFLDSREKSADEAEIVAVLDGRIVGTAGIDCVGKCMKVRHRAEFGVNILKEYWNLGIGRAITEACIECARVAGYRQLELNVVAENPRAVSLYESEGFREYGRNARGFLAKNGKYQEVVSMSLELC